MEIMVLRKILAGNVKKRRKELGWPQEEVARRAGFVQSHMSRIERFESGATVDILAGLATAFGCQAWELLIDNDAMRREAVERMLDPRAPTSPPPEAPSKRVAHQRRPPRKSKK